MFAVAAALIAVQIIDLEKRRDPAGAPAGTRVAGAWEALPFYWALTTVRGDGRRKIAVFSDPNCPYCKDLEGKLAQLDDLTLHVFPYAVLGPDSVRKARAVWCAKDRVKAWDELMRRHVVPQAPADCDAPIDALVEIGQRLGVRGTPTWFLENGTRHTGTMTVEKLRAALDAAAPARRAVDSGQAAGPVPGQYAGTRKIPGTR
jgi:thiol:disulfide interchange protein DsbC